MRLGFGRDLGRRRGTQCVLAHGPNGSSHCQAAREATHGYVLNHPNPCSSLFIRLRRPLPGRERRGYRHIQRAMSAYANLREKYVIHDNSEVVFPAACRLDLNCET